MGDIKKKHLDGEGLDYLIAQLDERYNNSEIEVPTKTSDLINDSGFISEIPAATLSAVGGIKPDGSTVTVDSDGTLHASSGGGSGADMSNYYTKSQVDNIISDLDIPEVLDYSGYTGGDYDKVPTVGKVSQFIDDIYQNINPRIPTKTSDLTNDSGFMTSLPSHRHNYSDIDNVPNGSTSTAGVVKVDGTTITADADGTIHSVGGGSADLSNYYTKTQADEKFVDDQDILTYSGYTGGDYDKVPSVGKMCQMIDDMHQERNAYLNTYYYTATEVDELVNQETVEPSQIRKMVILTGNRIETKSSLEPIPTYNGSTYLTFENNVILRIVKQRELVDGVLKITDYEDYSGTNIVIPNTTEGYLDDYIIYNFITSVSTADSHVIPIGNNLNSSSEGYIELGRSYIGYYKEEYGFLSSRNILQECFIVEPKDKTATVGGLSDMERLYYCVMSNLVKGKTYTIECDHVVGVGAMTSSHDYPHNSNFWGSMRAITSSLWGDLPSPAGWHLYGKEYNGYGGEEYLLPYIGETIEGGKGTDRYVYGIKSDYIGNSVTFTVPNDSNYESMIIFGIVNDENTGTRSSAVLTEGSSSYSELIGNQLSGTIVSSDNNSHTYTQTVDLYNVMTQDVDYFRYKNEPIYKYYDFDSFVGNWALIGTTSGSGSINLPNDFSELFVVVKSNAWNNYTFSIPRMVLNHNSAVTDVDVPGGEYYKDGGGYHVGATLAYMDYITYLISDQKAKLVSYQHNENSVSGIDLTSSCTVYWYYR